MDNSKKLMLGIIAVLIIIVVIFLALSFFKKSQNHPPQISDIVAEVKNVEAGKDVNLTIPSVNDPDGDPVIFTWSANKGKVPSSPLANAAITYTAPQTIGQDVVTVVASDNKGGIATKTITLNIVSAGNVPEPIESQLEIKITSPKPQSVVELVSSISGTYEGELPQNKYMWVVINPHPSPGQWWPQGGRISPWEGSWHVQANFGRKIEDAGAKFDIAVILVNQDDDQHYYTYLQNGERTENFPGEPLVPSAKIMDKVTVIRK